MINLRVELHGCLLYIFEYRIEEYLFSGKNVLGKGRILFRVQFHKLSLEINGEKRWLQREASLLATVKRYEEEKAKRIRKYVCLFSILFYRKLVFISRKFRIVIGAFS